MTGPLVIRAASSADEAACRTIVQLLPDYFTPDVPDRVADDLAAHGGWVADEPAGAGVIGFAIAERRGADAAEILWAAVTPERRNRGVGAQLIDHVLDGLAGEGMSVVEVKTLDESAGYEPYVATRAFWGGRGFVQIDTIDPLPGWQPGNPSAIFAAALRVTRTVRAPDENQRRGESGRDAPSPP